MKYKYADGGATAEYQDFDTFLLEIVSGHTTNCIRNEYFMQH